LQEADAVRTSREFRATIPPFSRRRINVVQRASTLFNFASSRRPNQRQDAGVERLESQFLGMTPTPLSMRRQVARCDAARLSGKRSAARAEGCRLRRRKAIRWGVARANGKRS